MSASTERFSLLTTQIAPLLRPILDEHLIDFDEMLPHLYFGDVSRWVAGEIANEHSSPQVYELLEFLDASFPGAHPDVQNLIDVSFVEMVQDDPDIVRILGPHLLARVDSEFLPGR